MSHAGASNPGRWQVSGLASQSDTEQYLTVLSPTPSACLLSVDKLCQAELLAALHGGPQTRASSPHIPLLDSSRPTRQRVLLPGRER